MPVREWVSREISLEEMSERIRVSRVVYHADEGFPREKHNARALWFRSVIDIAYKEYNVAGVGYEALLPLFEKGLTVEQAAKHLGDIKDEIGSFVIGKW